MEAVPKFPMLKFDVKLSPDNGDFLETIKKLIKIIYNEDPDLFVKELEEIGKLRSNSCIRPKEDVTGVADLKRYYSQLHLLQNRFKLEGGDKGPFNFSWSDPYSGTMYTLPDFDYELASVLYNLGSLHSILGAAERRDTSESMKVACTHFQCAAWAFHTLPDRYPKVYTPDISPDLMAVMSQICLAQAQECILEKSILDHRKSSIISKVGTQVSDYYFAALHKLETSNARHLTSDILLLGGAPPGEETVMESIGHKNNADWIRRIEFKFVYHKAVAHLYAGLNSEELQKMGERITHFQASLDKLMECAKVASSNAKDGGIWKEALTFSNDVIKGKLDNAKKENEFIYHEKVPELDTLVELKGASLVKGIGFEVTDREVAGADIFTRLVPLEAHEASSLYSEEKAKVLRVIGEEIESKNNALALFMSSMSLDEDGVVPKPDDHIALPQELIEVAASLSVKGEDNVTVHLKNAMSRIAAVSAEVETSLKEIRDILKNNEEQEKEFFTIVKIDMENDKSSRANITQVIASECEKFEGAHKMASDSNSTLHNAIRLHMDNLKLLTLPLEKLQKEIPSMADLDEESEANVAEVRRILLKVDEMKEQRLKLESAYRHQLMEDDITKKLVLHKDKQLPEIFEIELKKHDQASKLLRTNLSAQSNIIKALTEVNAKYVETRRIIADLTNSRNEMIGSLVASFYAHEDLLHKATKGLEFYDKLDSNVTKLLHRVQGVVKAHQEERDAVLAKYDVGNTTSGNAPSMDNISNYYPHAPPMYMESPSSGQKDIGSMPYLPTIKPENKIEGEIHVPSSAMGGTTAQTAYKDPVNVPSGKPTLKDYLKIMKENKNDASAAYAAMNYPSRRADEFITTDDSKPPPAGLPSVRPTPVGSESVEPLPTSHFQQNIVSQHPPTFHGTQNERPNNQRNPQLYPNPYTSQNTQGTAYNTVLENKNLVLTPGYPPKLEPASQFSSVVNATHTDTMRYPIAPGVAVNTMNESSRYQIPTAISGPPRFPVPQHHPVSHYGLTQSTSIAGTNYSSTSQAMPSSIQTVNHPQTNYHVLNSNQLMSNQSAALDNKSLPSSANMAMAIQGTYPISNSVQSIQNPILAVGHAPVNPPNAVPASHLPNANAMTGAMYGTETNNIVPSSVMTNMVCNTTQYNQTVPNMQPHINQYGYPTSSPNVNNNFNNATGQYNQSIIQAPYSIGSNVSSKFNPAPKVENSNAHFTATGVSVIPDTNTQNKQASQSLTYNPPVVQQSMYPNQSQTSGAMNCYNTIQGIQTTFYGSNTMATNQRGNISQTNAMSFKSQGVRQGNEQSQYYAPCQRTIQYPTNVPVIAQQTYQNVMSNQSFNVQAPSTVPKWPPPDSSVANNVGPNVISNTEFKMKPIVPQPGTEPLTPNVNPNPSYPINSTQQIKQNVLPNLSKQQHQTIAKEPSTEPVNINPVAVKRSSSFDDMLNNDQDDVDASSSVITLQPKILTPNELAEQKRQAKALQDIVKASNRDPYEDKNNQKMLQEDIDMMENKFIPTSDGKDQMWLDDKWKMFNSFVTAGSSGNSEVALGGGALSVARCYPMKNRAPDILPFDSSRVELPTTKDDYINASHIRHLSPHAPNFIATQWPPANTHNDFWTMVWQEQTEIIVSLLKDPPVQKDVYWPTERKDVMKVVSASSGNKSALSLDVTLQSIKVDGKNEEGQTTALLRTERTFTILNKETNTSRVVIQLQLEINANTSGKPLIKSLSDLAAVCLAYHRQQRVLTHPIIAHCLDGSGRTASFILMVAAASEIDIAIGANKDEVNEQASSRIKDSFKIFPDLVKMAALMAQQRKGILRERHHFKNAYEGMIMHSRSILIKKGVLKPAESSSNSKSFKLQDIGTIDIKLQEERKSDGIVAEEINMAQMEEIPDNFRDEVKDESKSGNEERKSKKKEPSPNFFSTELLSTNLTDLNLSDPLGLTNTRDSPQRRRITKKDFMNASTSSLSKIGKGSTDDNDPLSQLDPLWSMK